jgi:hypothetical protein
LVTRDRYECMYVVQEFSPVRVLLLLLFLGYTFSTNKTLCSTNYFTTLNIQQEAGIDQKYQLEYSMSTNTNINT